MYRSLLYDKSCYSPSDHTKKQNHSMVLTLDGRSENVAQCECVGNYKLNCSSKSLGKICDLMSISCTSFLSSLFNVIGKFVLYHILRMITPYNYCMSKKTCQF